MGFTSINDKVGRDLIRMLYSSTETFGTPTPGGNRQVEVVYVGILLDASANIYDGMIVYVNHDLTAIGLPDHVFVMEANNAPLTPGDYVVACRQTDVNVIHEGTSSATLGSFTTSGAGSGGGDIRPLFVCGSSGGGGNSDVEICRITGQFIKDSEDVTACDGGPSPNCHYPAQPQKLSCAGWEDDTDKTPIWIVFWSTFAAVDNGTDPFTVVAVDGTAGHSAKYMRYSYGPTDADSELAWNGQTRPVYGSTEFASGVAINCSGSEPVLTLNQ